MIGHRLLFRDALRSNRSLRFTFITLGVLALAAAGICAKPQPVKVKFRSLLQPTFTTCGQTSVAMVTGVDVPTVVKVVGTDRGTTPAQLLYALHRLQPASPAKIVRLKGQDPGATSIVELFDTSAGKFHWTVFHEGAYYDPIFGKVSNYPGWMQKQVAIVLN